MAKQSWNDAHMSPTERTAKVREEQQRQGNKRNINRPIKYITHNIMSKFMK